jgi:hypothetical protein
MMLEELESTDRTFFPVLILHCVHQNTFGFHTSCSFCGCAIIGDSMARQKEEGMPL